MPTFHDPLADAAEASEALPGLAHASRVFDDPADTYRVFGDLVAGVRSLRQVLDQLAATHLNARDRAFDDDGNPAAGAASALAAADELHQAGTLLDQAYDRLDAAFSHSGRIAWHPEPVIDREAARERLAARLGGDPETTTVQAGTLTLTVWPDAPVGEHQRYAYRIADTTTGQELEGRDLFTGAGTPVDPHHAIRDLATFLSAAGQARQYALDHPGSSPEHEGLFPAWVAEAARTNTDALAELSEHTGSEPEQAVGRRWLNVAFLQGEEADAVLDLIDRDGAEAAIAHLSGYDYGEETTQAALENGYVYDDKPPTGSTDRTVTTEGYALTYNHGLGHVGLYREFDTPPDPALHEVQRPASAVVNEQPHHAPAPAREAPAAQRAALGADRDWYASPAGTISQSGRGLSL
ncbi:hypothetical protein ONR57_09150 [Hoyosella sp. YIM 151337]|uniref:hypothetical protein n=1 Tax=Hoyosella sp. YIM 151337 TaxID=2992742 RepID=UPI0022369954|nr:hypothetical protein [Hoyosella sp. YIM 151337]MCW4353462.1 hypothetical protein [Hoyosella sp. YIM 151337]